MGFTAIQSNMQTYDSIVAVTQYNINGNFNLLFGKSDGIHPSLDVRIENPKAEIKGIIRAPRVRLRVKDSPRKVVFTIEIPRGILTYWTGDGPSSKQQQMKISNWIIGFRVNLSLSDLDKRLDIPAAVKAQIDHLGAGMFSVRQLFMDFQTAGSSSWDPQETVLPNLLEDPDAIYYFTQLMDAYMTQLCQNGHHILGYAIRVVNPNIKYPDNPSFPPTDFDFWVNPYAPDGNVNAPATDPGLDTLCYLMMTQNRPMPSSTPSWFGNWATSKEEFGAVAISKENFFDRFLLPHLATTTNLSTAFTEAEGHRVDNKTSRGAAYTPTATGGTYSSPTSIKLEYDVPLIQVDLTWSANHNSTVLAKANESTITVSGVSDLTVNYVFWMGYRNKAATEWLKVGTKLTWSVLITLVGVVEGELQIGVSQPVVDSNDTVEMSADIQLLKDLVTQVRADLDARVKDHNKLLQEIVDTKDLQTKITAALSSMNAFVFPGGNDFRLFNPRFNEHLDLVVNLRWEQG